MIVPEKLDVELLIFRDISSPAIVQNAFAIFAFCKGYTSISTLPGSEHLDDLRWEGVVLVSFSK
jgi:hypothetical protein